VFQERLHLFSSEVYGVALLFLELNVGQGLLSFAKPMLSNDYAYPDKVVRFHPHHVIEQAIQHRRVVAALPSDKLVWFVWIDNYFIRQVERADQDGFLGVDCLLGRLRWLRLNLHY
jgi:hypothetical protein